jgi:hypothetical protein
MSQAEGLALPQTKAQIRSKLNFVLLSEKALLSVKMIIDCRRLASDLKDGLSLDRSNELELFFEAPLFVEAPFQITQLVCFCDTHLHSIIFFIQESSLGFCLGDIDEDFVNIFI